MERTELPKYDSTQLSYANTFTDPKKRFIIKAIEFLTAKPILLSKVREFERQGMVFGQGFWTQALAIMKIDILTSDAEIERIPASGPLIVVANHPHGFVDGMVLAALIGRVRTDYKILTRSLLLGTPQADQFLIPVPFDHEDGALEKGLEMRRVAMAHLDAGGAIIVFPSGKVANSKTFFGPIVEGDWNPFTAKMVMRSKAQVVPIFFPGRNSRAYQIAAQISATLRQSLLLFEVKHALGKAQRPHVGDVITRDEIAKWAGNQRGFIAWLRAKTLTLGD